MKVVREQDSTGMAGSLRARGDARTATADGERFAPGAPPLAATETRRGILRQAALGLGGLGLAGLLAACGSSGGQDQGDEERSTTETPVAGVTDVAVRDNSFEPAAIEIPVGATVTWRWEGDHDHNVVGDGFESETQTEGTFAQTFAEAGRHEYRCTLHGGMRGEVVVIEGASA